MTKEETTAATAPTSPSKITPKKSRSKKKKKSKKQHKEREPKVLDLFIKTVLPESTVSAPVVEQEEDKVIAQKKPLKVFTHPSYEVFMAWRLDNLQIIEERVAKPATQRRPLIKWKHPFDPMFDVFPAKGKVQVSRGVFYDKKKKRISMDWRFHGRDIGLLELGIVPPHLEDSIPLSGHRAAKKYHY